MGIDFRFIFYLNIARVYSNERAPNLVRHNILADAIVCLENEILYVMSVSDVCLLYMSFPENCQIQSNRYN
jgi:hypothetical protein